MKTKRIKARLHEGPPYGAECFHYEWILPADAESYERMVEQVRRKICLAHRVFPKATIGWTNGLEYKSDARAALRAIGITAPKHGKKGSK